MAETASERKKKENDEAKAIINDVLTHGKVKKDFSKVEVQRGEVNQIVVPNGMPLETAIDWLKRQQMTEEKQVTFSMDFKAYPLDGAYALYRAMKNIFGFVDLTADKGPSGNTPPHMVGVKLPNGTTIQVPWGKMQFPGLDADSYLETVWNSKKMTFEIHGKFKKKFEEVVARIADETIEILRNESIYKGHAIRIDLAWVANNEHPTDPLFLDKDVQTLKEEDVLMTPATRTKYNTGVLMRIEKTAVCKKNNIPLKHGCLLAGPYGTGKTLIAKLTAKKAIANGWTFIYLEDCRQMKDALRMAEMYAPAVLFAEDIDKAIEGERSSQMNEILNTLDGIDTKHNPIITILTTNHIENINKAFLRAGRIDSLIKTAPLDEETALQFIKNFGKNAAGKSVLVETDDYTRAAQSLSGIVPAFGSEIMNMAKMDAIYNNGEDALIGNNNIVGAAESFKEHIELSIGVKEPTFHEKLGMNVMEQHGLINSGDKKAASPAKK